MSWLFFRRVGNLSAARSYPGARALGARAGGGIGLWSSGRVKALAGGTDLGTVIVRVADGHGRRYSIRAEREVQRLNWYSRC